MRRRFFNIKKLLNNFINYSSSDNQIVTPYAADFGSVLLKNVMIDGVGTLLFKSNVVKIGIRAFYDCTSLTTITIPNSVTEIGNLAFEGCKSLKEFKEKFASIDGRCLIVDGKLRAFAPAGLTSYTIPDSVTEIGDYVFEHCKSITNVTIGNSVTEIGYSVFRNCSSLTSITIGNSVTKIGIYAFYMCDSLISVYCKPTTPPTLGNNAVFDSNVIGRKIYVPYQSLDAYKTATYWSEYADDIVGYDFENDTVVGGNKIEFPITLVIGDNGQLGIDLYNYLIAVMPEGTTVSCPNDEYSIGEIIIQGWGNADALRIFSTETAQAIQISNSIMREDALIPSLRSDGYFN